MDYTSRHPVPLDSQKKTLAEQGLDDDDKVVVNRVLQDNMSGASQRGNRQGSGAVLGKAATEGS